MKEKVIQMKLPEGTRYRRVEVTEDGTLNLFYTECIIPIEGEWFEVIPTDIRKELFLEEREDRKQEWTRKEILNALEELEKNPQYSRPFETLMPEKTWEYTSIASLFGMAKRLGDHNADWVEYELELAYRISSGESWEDICNKYDKANWHRVIIGHIGHARIVGGARKSFNGRFPASDFLDGNYDTSQVLDHTVPKVVRYK